MIMVSVNRTRAGDSKLLRPIHSSSAVILDDLGQSYYHMIMRLIVFGGAGGGVTAAC